jgi:hypothetical protein
LDEANKDMKDEYHGHFEVDEINMHHQAAALTSPIGSMSKDHINIIELQPFKAFLCALDDAGSR